MLSRAVTEELRRVAVGVVVLVVAGLAVGHLGLVLLAGATGYLLLHLLQAYRLARWLRSLRFDELPETYGIWGEIFRELHRLQERHQQRKHRLAGIIDRFRQASEATPDAAAVLGADGKIEWLNSAAGRLLGLRSPHDIGRHIGDLVRTPAFSRYLLANRYEESIEIPSPISEDVMLSVRVVPYGDDRRLLLARDVTRIHRLEQVRRDFVANVSHELRSPLTVIRGYVETLIDGDAVSPEWQRPLQHIDQQTTRMCRIVDDLLQLSRLESNPQAAGMDPVAVAGMLETIRDDARGLTGEDPKIHVQADAEVQLCGEYNELYSAFSNLVFNAVQYTPVSKNIYLRWYADRSGGHLEVEDQGMGIEPEHIPRLTERFYRVDKARSRAVGGTGLGLAIVKHVLARHDGRLRVTSALGEGSRFICDFPASRILRMPSAQRANA